MENCSVCKKKGRTKCQQCNKRVYCSLKCMKKDSPEHNEICGNVEGASASSRSGMMENCSKMLSKLGMGSIPDFHLEYASKYGKEKKQIKKLTSVQNAFTVISAVSSNTSIIARNLEEDAANPNIFLKRWGQQALKKEFHHFLQTKPLHSIYEQKTHSYTPNVFQSMKNYNLPEWMFDYGKTHVSIGCVDFQQLLLGRLNPCEDDTPLVFYGIDSASVSIARCWVLYQMMRNGAEPLSVLQVWFSTGWTDETNRDFVQALADLINSEIEEDVVKILNHWQTAKLDVKKVPSLWATDLYKEERNAPFEACANFEHETDRVDYARYLFTGFIFAEEDSLQHGNVTMFSLPEDVGCKKSEDENFFHTFNFGHAQFAYQNSLMESVQTFMMKKTKEMTKQIQSRKIQMNFKVAAVGLDNVELLNEIKAMNAYTIDWSNIIDYFSKKDFLKLSEAASSEDTVHYVHLMNWVNCYKGASVFDYEYGDKIILIDQALKAHRDMHQFKIRTNPSYSKMWARQMKYENPTNLVDYALTVTCRNTYLEFLFGKEISFQMYTSFADSNLRRSHTTICGGFTFDKETTFGILPI